MRCIWHGGLLCLLLAVNGCTLFKRHEPPSAPSVALLDERSFDEFATTIADGLPELLVQQGQPLPARMPVPVIGADSIEEPERARAFARALAAGLNDRLEGQALFVSTARTNCDLVTRLFFADGGRHRSVIFGVFRDELLLFSASADYRSDGQQAVVRRPTPQATAAVKRPAPAAATPPPIKPPPDTAAKPTGTESAETESPRSKLTPEQRAALERKYPPRERIEIDGPADVVGAQWLRSLRTSPRFSYRGLHGAVMFVNDDSSEHIRLVSQHAQRLPNGLRCEFDIRSVDRTRRGRLRIAFYNERNQIVEVTDVRRHRFTLQYARIVSIASTHPDASKYICVVEE